VKLPDEQYPLIPENEYSMPQLAPLSALELPIRA
jgi:hypothetical protein